MIRDLKQPHQDVPRPYGDDPLLTLDGPALAFRDALIKMSRHLSNATLVGNPAPVVARMCERLRKPQPGDLVMEMTAWTHWRSDDHRAKAFGRLILERVEWWETDEDWAAQLVEEDGALSEEDRRTDHVWYVQYGPDHVCRWTNCSFIVLPVDIDDFTMPAAVRNGDAAVFTRDSLVSSLSDSGFSFKPVGAQQEPS
jgi:hypothetical protein